MQGCPCLISIWMIGVVRITTLPCSIHIQPSVYLFFVVVVVDSFPWLAGCADWVKVLFISLHNCYLAIGNTTAQGLKSTIMASNNSQQPKWLIFYSAFSQSILLLDHLILAAHSVWNAYPVGRTHPTQHLHVEFRFHNIFQSVCSKNS